MSEALNRARENMRKVARAARSGDLRELTETQRKALKAIQAQNEQIVKDLVKTLGPDYLRADAQGREVIKVMGLANGWWDDFERELAKNPPQPAPGA